MQLFDTKKRRTCELLTKWKGLYSLPKGKRWLYFSSFKNFIKFCFQDFRANVASTHKISINWRLYIFHISSKNFWIKYCLKRFRKSAYHAVDENSVNDAHHSIYVILFLLDNRFRVSYIHLRTLTKLYRRVPPTFKPLCTFSCYQASVQKRIHNIGKIISWETQIYITLQKWRIRKFIRDWNSLDYS